MLQFHGGEIFGKAANDPSRLAETMLGLMINCLHGGPKFLLNMLPVSKLNADFLYNKINDSIAYIKSGSGKVKVIISDGNRVNQSAFKKFDTVENMPWKTNNGTYLLYDFVHLLKNIRNLWLTEKTASWNIIMEEMLRLLSGKTFATSMRKNPNHLNY